MGSYKHPLNGPLLKRNANSHMSLSIKQLWIRTYKRKMKDGGGRGRDSLCLNNLKTLFEATAAEDVPKCYHGEQTIPTWTSSHHMY